MHAEDARKSESFLARLTGLQPDCPCCGKQLVTERLETPAHYFEASDGATRGLLGGDCFTGLLTTSIYSLTSSLAADDPARLLIEESSRESAFAFRPVGNGSGTMVDFYRFDLGGVPITRKTFPLRETTGNILTRRPDPLYTLISKTLMGSGGKLREAFLLVCPVDREAPETVLRDESYREFIRLRNQVTTHLT
jgi:hypothetical protein